MGMMESFLHLFVVVVVVAFLQHRTLTFAVGLGDFGRERECKNNNPFCFEQQSGLPDRQPTSFREHC